MNWRWFKESQLLDAISPATFDPQPQSPLFGKLCGELRNQIFALVLAEYEDWGRQYFVGKRFDPDLYCAYARPGWYAPWSVDWTLLLTCRRAYHETCCLPRRQAVHRWALHVPDDMPRGADWGGNVPKNIGCTGSQILTSNGRHNMDNITELRIQTDPESLNELICHVRKWEKFAGPDAFPNLQCLTLILVWHCQFLRRGELRLEEISDMVWPEVRKRLTFELEIKNDDERDRGRLEALVGELRAGALKLTTINGTPLVPAAEWRSYKWLLAASDDVLDTELAENVGLVEYETEMLVHVCDYVPGRPPALWKDIRDEVVYDGREPGNDILSDWLRSARRDKNMGKKRRRLSL
ncbi:tRNA-specific adenosine deaminase [Purpureocillium lavendulum]|uniref:tRNA-specific adenosine deaminase n=1 Tax=Purpureocillium lavendulum TaxID=1247861 RepID=A0AB34FY53_9HYPO|nr:tRNA-specific adenosine deaminase [Purpureocillium lavendulum]